MNRLIHPKPLALAALASALSFTPTHAAEPADAFVGNWALTIPNDAAGWLGVTRENGYLDATLLWGGGSVLPVSNIYIDGDTLHVIRISNLDHKNDNGNVLRTHQTVETITATVKGDRLMLVTSKPLPNGLGVSHDKFTGKRIPPVPAAPDLSKVKFGKPISLFNGKDLTGWRLTNPSNISGWSVENGILINRPVQEEGKPHKAYGNLRTDREFEDFNLTTEVRLVKGGNSGIYLKGIYEVQVTDSFGKPLNPHNMGAVYSRICPSASAEKPPGEWQTLDITLVDRHITVILNGTKIIDNQPVPGCTGGALWADEFRPGPIYIQGDHTGIDYRNMIIRPVVK